MSEVPFERYDAEFESLSGQVQGKISKVGGGLGDSDIKYCQGLLSQCDDLLKQMQIEARSVDNPDEKKTFLQKVRTCKARLSNLRDDYNSAKTGVERESLLGDGGDLEMGSHRKGSSKQKERLLSANNQVAKQNETLDRARRVMAETEETAMEITEELGRNREKIDSSHQRVRDVSGLTNQARRIVQSMSRREVQQKLMMYAVGALLVLAVIVIIYSMGR
jgi:vesicle transport through interaction with t-SNAREs protein 1